MKEIALSRGLFALVDDDDYELVMDYKWCATRGGRGGSWYAMRCERVGDRQRSILMHRLILNAPNHLQVDHRNRNGLDNRRSNIRLCTQSQNIINTDRFYARKTSAYRGVGWHAGAGRWMARIVPAFGVAQRYLGLFADEVEAAKAYDRAALRHHGDFAVTNFPKETYDADV